jgi:sarcosine oxidase, subunit delta
MLVITCPYCGPRDETEFACGGEAHIVRPEKPAELTDAQWADYLFMRKNIKGVHYERWLHSHGCRRWFNAVRDTVSHQIFVTYKMGEQPPAISKPEGTP